MATANQPNPTGSPAAWIAAFDCYGTAAIFEERARKLKFWMNALKIVGIVFPVLVGGSVMTFGLDEDLKPLLYVAGVVGLAQLVLSAIALAMNWDDSYANAKEAQAHSTKLFDDYKKVAERAKADLSKPDRAALEQHMALLDVEAKFREQTDLKANISGAEKRYGYRLAGHHLQRECASCNKIPNPRMASNCVTCGV